MTCEYNNTLIAKFYYMHGNPLLTYAVKCNSQRKLASKYMQKMNMSKFSVNDKKNSAKFNIFGMLVQ